MMENSSTYEAHRARESNYRRPDRIHWQQDSAYRNQNYRHLDHQRGTIGNFEVRLLEAADLKRSHWSALALGPVRLLGLSNAHGAVSSFCTLSLSFEEIRQEKIHQPLMEDSKPEAKPSPNRRSHSYRSPVIPQDDNPVWNDCNFEIPLAKGSLQDGQRICLQLRVDEGSTAVENMMSGVPSGGNERLLGTGSLDITSLCMGTHPTTMQPQVGVLDTWIPIRMNKEDVTSSMRAEPNKVDPLGKPDALNAGASDGSTGRVRILVTYAPHGMTPQSNDIVAFEAFARRDPNEMSCSPIVSPTLPLQVRQVSGPWLLVEYQMQDFNAHTQVSRSSPPHSTSMTGRRQGKKACLRIHRNTVFVIERKNLIDETINLALLPADVFLATPLGQSTLQVTKPLIIASRQLIMPALLSAKLFWMALKTTTFASLTGVSAATSAIWSEGSQQLTSDDDEPAGSMQVAAYQPSSKYKFISL